MEKLENLGNLDLRSQRAETIRYILHTIVDTIANSDCT